MDVGFPRASKKYQNDRNGDIDCYFFRCEAMILLPQAMGNGKSLFLLDMLAQAFYKHSVRITSIN